MCAMISVKKWHMLNLWRPEIEIQMYSYSALKQNEWMNETLQKDAI